MSFGQQFFDDATTYILCWPGDDETTARWAGENLLLPSRNEVARATDANGQPIKGSRFRFNGAVARDGRQLPGTLVLQDRFTVESSTGGRVKAFDAQGFVNGIWNNLPLRARGFRVVKTVDDVEKAMAEGRPQWEKQRIAAAEQTIRDEVTRRKLDEAAGIPYRESSDAQTVKEAHQFLMTVRREQKESIPTGDLMEALTGGPVPPQPPPVAQAEKPVVPELSDALIMGQALFNRAAELNVNLTKAELSGLLKGDESVLDSVSRRLEEETRPVAKGA
jgi:hypothetical protein